MKLRFVSDTHLGLQRQSHTTPDSAKRMQQALFDAAMEATIPEDGVIVIHAGDLFDKYDNNSFTEHQGFNLAYRCDFVLAGNHDCSNRTDAMSSLDLVGEWLGRLGTNKTTVIKQDTHIVKLPGAWLSLVPHQLTQADFERKLSDAAFGNNEDLKVLVTHCNYDNRLTEKSESSLNLTRELAEELLKTFDFIFLGHEHTPRTDFDGRLVVLGSLMPTSFSDISDKVVWELDTETREVSRKQVWSKQAGFVTLDWKVMNVADEVRSSAQFLDITGTATPSEMPEVAKLIQDCWDYGPNLLMVRNSVAVEGEEAVAVSEAHRHVNVVGRIREELKGTDMGVRFEGYVNG